MLDLKTGLGKNKYGGNMVKNSRGFLSGRTRNLKHKRKLTVSDMVRTYEVGNKVLVSVKPVRDGMPAPRYNGKH